MFIEITEDKGGSTTISVNVLHIITFRAQNGGTFISLLDDQFLDTKETYDEIKALIKKAEL